MQNDAGKDEYSKERYKETKNCDHRLYNTAIKCVFGISISGFSQVQGLNLRMKSYLKTG